MGGKVAGDKGPDFFSFHGRAGQGEWLWGMIQSTIVGVLAGGIPYIGLILTLPLTIRLVAVSTRRMHDLKLSGWLQLVPMVCMAATIALFLGFQQFGLADYRHVLGLDALDTDLFPTEPTLSELLSVPSRYRELGGISPMEWIPIAMYWVSGLGYLILYGAMLFAPGTNGPNCYGEADRQYA